DDGKTSIDALNETVNLTQTQAVALDNLLAGQGKAARGVVAPGVPDLRLTILRWQDQRERVWYRTQSLLWHVDDANPARRDRAIARLHADLDDFTSILQRLGQDLQAAAQQRAAETLRGIHVSFIVTLLMLLLLLLGVAEPLVRFVRVQSASLRRQTEQRRRLALVAERTANWVAVLDREGRVLWCNDAFLLGKGLPRAGVIGQKGALMGQNEANDAARMEALLADLARGNPVRVEVLHQDAHGREAWLDVDYQPIRDAQGARMVGFTVVATDITEAKSHRLRLRTLRDGLPVGVVMQDIKGKVIEGNTMAAEMLGRRG
ncbi:PAS domain-containing protein, partial [Leptospira sp. SA-E8]|uniref:PAS domain-containing protein n=1 Tax=Leptospira sp. SA-E8 TaxID=3422259 RepID=UPI003EBC91FB